MAWGSSRVLMIGRQGFELFLDLKYHDIPNTVASALRVAADMGVWMVNVHASGGRKMLEAAADAVAHYRQPPLLIAVTVLTSLSESELHDELGIDIRLGAAALAAQRESQLLDLASTARVSWQGEALLNLATGATIEEIREDFGLRPSRDVAAEPTDADLIAGLRTRAARSTFTWLESDEDLRRAIEGLSFAEWQLFLHPQQRALVERRANGPMRVSGGAGTGKTVIAVHRAVELAKRDKADGQEPRILLTTYTRNLADDLRRQVAQLEDKLKKTII